MRKAYSSPCGPHLRTWGTKACLLHLRNALAFLKKLGIYPPLVQQCLSWGYSQTKRNESERPLHASVGGSMIAAAKQRKQPSVHQLTGDKKVCPLSFVTLGELAPGPLPHSLMPRSTDVQVLDSKWLRDCKELPYTLLPFLVPFLTPCSSLLLSLPF